MLQQFTVVEKCLPAQVTHKQILGTVNKHVGLERPGELLPALLAPEVFLACVDAEVSPEVVLQTKSYPAHLTDEGFFPCLDDLVLHQRSFQLERLSAVGAFERPLLRMNSAVGEQMSTRPEALPTGGTGERFFSGVNGLVLPQDALGGEFFPAGVADERPDSGVDGLVAFQQMHLTICLLAHGAPEGLLCFMTQQVCFKFLLESTPAARPHLPTSLLSR